MIDIFLTFVFLSGIFYGSQAWLKIKPEFCPLFCMSSVSVFLYFFALFGQLPLGAKILLYSGLFLFLFVLKDAWKNRGKSFFYDPNWLIFSVLVVACFVFSINMAFTVIDDYVYWGIIGKYLFLNDHLPIAGNPLDPRILAYTPGTALVHYFFYTLLGRYSVDISYTAQGLILISSLFVVSMQENFKKSIVSIGSLILLLSLFSGSVFTKLQVDYLLSMVVFSIFWIYRSSEKQWLKLLTISMPVCFLFLIKEIGFVIGLFVLVFILCDTIVRKGLSQKIKIQSTVIVFLMAAALFLLKILWTRHINAMGFVELHNGINLESIQKTLSVVIDPHIRAGFLIFIKAIFFESADRLNLPYIFWYAAILFLVIKSYRAETGNSRQRWIVFSGLILFFCTVYLFLLYCLQIIMFNVGQTFDQTIGFSRYWNIVFSPILLTVVLSFFDRHLFRIKKIGKRTAWSMAIIVMIVLLASRVEVTMHREKEDVQVQQAAEKLFEKLPCLPHSVGMISGKQDNLACLQFLYYLLPHKVDHHSPKFVTQKAFIQYTKKFDYVIVYQPGEKIVEWLDAGLNHEGIEKGIHLLKVIHRESEIIGSESAAFERISD